MSDLEYKIDTTGIDWGKLASGHRDDSSDIPSVSLGMKDGRFQQVVVNGVDIGPLTTDVKMDLNAGSNQHITVAIKFLARLSMHEANNETD